MDGLGEEESLWGEGGGGVYESSVLDPLGRGGVF